MKLLIVESPAKAKTIEKYLGKDYKVLSSYGHIRGIPSEQGAIDPEQNFAVRYEITAKSPKYVDSIIQAAKKADEIYLATDQDREGEAISWHITEVLRQKGQISNSTKMYRVTFNEITPRAIKEALTKPRTINMDLVHAQQARQALDYLVGFTLSPILWRKLPGSKSAGRVQSVALRMICERELDIKIFKSQEYWSVEAQFITNEKESRKFNAELVTFKGKKLEKLDISNASEAEDIVTELEHCNYNVDKVIKKQTKRKPSPPFTTSTLLQDASRKLGFSARKTAQVAQKLYEGIDIAGQSIGLITYMRTDSVHINDEAAQSANQLIKKLFGPAYAPNEVRKYKNKAKNAQEAHEAIRPTDINNTPEQIKNYLEADHFKLYELIWKRLVASQMTDMVLDNTTIEILAQDDADSKLNINKDKQLTIFKAVGSIIAFPGFSKVYSESSNSSITNTNGVNGEKSEDNNEIKETKQILPELNDNQDLNLEALNKIQHFTQPPPRYNEASLIKKMEELGIGRPSTYPNIISILQDRQYVSLDNKRFISEERGYLVNAFLLSFFDEYIEYTFTAKLEDELDSVSKGEIDYHKILFNFWYPFKDRADKVIEFKTTTILETIENRLFDYIFDDYAKSENKIKCLQCNTGELHLKNSKYGSFIGCSDYPKCNFSRPLLQQIREKTADSIQNPNSLNSLNNNGELKDISNNLSIDNNYPKELGMDLDTGAKISLNKGPYGFYVMSQIQENNQDLAISNEDKSEKKSKSAKSKSANKNNRKLVGIPKNVSIEQVDLEYAKKLLSLPWILDKNPSNNKEIKLNIGRFGPYIEHDGQFYSIKQKNFFDITTTEALSLIESKKDVKTKVSAKTKATSKRKETKK